MSSKYEGVVVAKIPFEPFPFVRPISHRGLSGDNFTDCSMVNLPPSPHWLCAAIFAFYPEGLLGPLDALAGLLVLYVCL